jgi:endoglucanase Acf2
MIGLNKFTGIIRIAIIPDNSDSAEAILDNHISTYAVGANISYAKDTNTSALLSFYWNSIGSGPLLNLALPHHMDSILVNSDITFTLANIFQSIKGKMIGIIGNHWLLKEDLTQIKFFSPRGIDKNKTKDIFAALSEEQNEKPDFSLTSTYFYGKELAALARRVLISSELRCNLTQKLLTNLKNVKICDCIKKLRWL